MQASRLFLLSSRKLQAFKRGFSVNVNTRNIINDGSVYRCLNNITQLLAPEYENGEGLLNNFEYKPNDHVVQDQNIGSMEYDKIYVDLTAPVSGTIKHIYKQKNTEVQSNEVILDIQNDDPSNYESFIHQNDSLSSPNLFISTNKDQHDLQLKEEQLLNLDLDYLIKLYDTATFLLSKGRNKSLFIFKQIIQNSNLSPHLFNYDIIKGDKYINDLCEKESKKQNKHIPASHYKLILMAVYYNAAIAYQNNGFIPEALKLFQFLCDFYESKQIINSYNFTNNKYKFYSALAVVHLINKNINEATINYKKALSYHPNHVKSHYGLSIIHLINKNYYEACYHFGRAIGYINNNNLLHYRIIGQYNDFINNPQASYEMNLCNVPNITEILPSSTFLFSNVPENDNRYQQTTNINLNIDKPSLFIQPIEDSSFPSTDINKARTLLQNNKYNKHITLLTGAGLSKSTGLPTRQDLWQVYNRDDSVSVKAFQENPQGLWTVVRDFYNQALNVNTDISPSYEALKTLKGLKTIITQNVDGLHEYDIKDILNPDTVNRSSTKVSRCKTLGTEVIELHGTLNELICPKCYTVFKSPAIKHIKGSIPTCSSGTILKPNVVLFGEQVDLDKANKAKEAIGESSLMIIIGTASDVSPACDLIRFAKTAKVPLIEINTKRSRITSLVDFFLEGPSDVLLQQLLKP